MEGPQLSPPVQQTDLLLAGPCLLGLEDDRAPVQRNPSLGPGGRKSQESNPTLHQGGPFVEEVWGRTVDETIGPFQAGFGVYYVPSMTSIIILKVYN